MPPTLPRPSLERTADPLLRALREAGELTEEVVTDGARTHRTGLVSVSGPDSRLLDPSLAHPHPRRIALGAHTNARAVAAFARPRTEGQRNVEKNVAHTPNTASTIAGTAGLGPSCCQPLCPGGSGPPCVD